MIVAERVAVFVSYAWTDQMRLRVWAKQLIPYHTVVLLNDEPSEGNATLMRQLRCSEVVCLVARVPGQMRTLRAIEDAKRRRDEVMAELATVIVDFGDLPGGSTRFAGRQISVIQER